MSLQSSVLTSVSEPLLRIYFTILSMHIAVILAFNTLSFNKKYRNGDDAFIFIYFS